MADKSFIEFKLNPNAIKDIVPGLRALEYYHDNPDSSFTNSLDLLAEDVVPFYAAHKYGANPGDFIKEAILLALPTGARATKGKSKGRYIVDEETTKEINDKLKNADWATSNGLHLEEPYSATRAQSYNGSPLDLEYTDRQLLPMLLSEDELNRIIVSNNFKTGFNRYNQSKSKSNPNARASKVNTDEDLIREYAGEQQKLPYLDEPWEYTIGDLLRLNDKNSKEYKEYLIRKRVKEINKDFE